MKDADKGHQRFDFKSSHAKLGTQKSDEGNDRYVFEQLGFVRLNIRVSLKLSITSGASASELRHY